MDSNILNKIKIYIFTLIKIINTFFIRFLEIIINNKNYYRYNISIVLILLLVLIYYIIHNLNIFNLSNTKYSQIILLISGCVLFSIFYFFVYRNEYSKDEYYTDNTRRLINHDDGINKENLKDTILKPIFRLILSLFGGILIIIIPVAIIIGFFWLFNYQQMYDITKFILLLIFFISTLAIIISLFKVDSDITICLNSENTPKNIIAKIICIIKNIILFCPCLLIVLVDKINDELKLTPNSIYLLLIIELVVICLIFMIPNLFKFIASLNNNNLLNNEGPFYLDSKKIIGTYQQLTKDNDIYTSDNYKSYSLLYEKNNPEYNIKAEFNGPEKIIKKNPYKYTYSISFYLYINPQPTNTRLSYNKETELFNYGFKPVIYYDGRNRNLIIKSKTEKSEGNILDVIYKTDDIKYQKWIYFVINYDNNIIDIFMDGKLVGSKKNVPPFLSSDNVSIGDENGIEGSIKDIFYFDKIKSQDNVEFLYNLTKK